MLILLNNYDTRADMEVGAGGGRGGRDRHSTKPNQKHSRNQKTRQSVACFQNLCKPREGVPLATVFMLSLSTRPLLPPNPTLC